MSARRILHGRKKARFTPRRGRGDLGAARAAVVGAGTVAAGDAMALVTGSLWPTPPSRAGYEAMNRACGGKGCGAFKT